MIVKKHLLSVVFSLLIPITLLSCSPLVKPEQPIQTNLIPVEEGDTIGQTFLSRYNGLNGVSLYISSEDKGEGYLTFHLRSVPDSKEDLSQSNLPLEKVESPGYYTFQFPPIEDSARLSYYSYIEVVSYEGVWIGTAPGETYINGSYYLNGEPQDGQLAFQLSYDFQTAILGVLAESFVWLAWLVITIFLFVIPGWGLLGWLLRGWPSLSWGEKLGLAIGVSLAIYPVLMLWTNLIGLNLGQIYAWIPPIVGIVLILSRFILNFRKGQEERRKVSQPTSWNRRIRQNIQLVDIILMFIIGFTFLVRFWTVRSLDLPMWGDSLQHTMIAQLLVDNRGIFDSWQPYTELQTFTYHFGFHTLVAVFHWITNMTLPQSILWVGQILNGLAALALFPFAVRLGKNQWAGLIAVVIAGVLSPMPMFYTNWGRYTQLAGQVILPICIWLIWSFVLITENDKSHGSNLVHDDTANNGSLHRLKTFLTNIDWRLFSLSVLTLSGLALTHYRVLLFAILFFPAAFFFQLQLDRMKAFLSRTILLGCAAGLLFLPWFIHIFKGEILTIFAYQLTNLPSQSSSSSLQVNPIGNLATYLPVVLWLLLPFSIGWGLWKRIKGVALFCLWWFFILLAANPNWIHLPGVGSLDAFTYFIAAYIPASILLGASAGWGIDSLHQKLAKDKLEISQPKNRSVILPILLFISISFLVLWGVRQRLNDIQPFQFALGTRPDLDAADWIQKNIGEDARFLVNSFFAYNDTVVVGSDAGWWLPLLVSRATTLPPLNYAVEDGPRANYRVWINKLTRMIQEKGIDHPDVLRTLKDRDITHVYIGQRQGSVNNNGFKLDAQALLNSPNFHPIYQKDRVWIFEVIPSGN